jgi:hypothetical protein
VTCGKLGNPICTGIGERATTPPTSDPTTATPTSDPGSTTTTSDPITTTSEPEGTTHPA